jgi:beta-glucosidase
VLVDRREGAVADVEALIRELTLEEKAALTAGSGAFSTAAVERVGIPQINLTDGPSGARGLAWPGLGGAASTCIPCGSAVGATWDPDLAQQLGALVGQEAIDRGCFGLLAPTVNLHRSPLAGRNFECYSEDPLLSGRLACGYIRGVQSTGAFATVKHFVGNEAEWERGTINSIIDERSLRELYLVPFELAVREGGVGAVMTSYNRLNGKWLNVQHAYLLGLLRDEWGFPGLVMTDWYAVADTSTSLAAGLDLEMPGPGRALGTTLVEAVEAGDVPESDLDDALRRLLSAFDRLGALDVSTLEVEPGPTRPDHVTLVRRAAAEATVLLTNDGTLPLDRSTIRRLAIIGPNAARPVVVGGGSASMVLHRLPDMVAALTEAVGPHVEVTYERGCEITATPVPVGRGVLGVVGGFEMEVFDGTDLEGEPIERRHLDQLRIMALRSRHEVLGRRSWSCRVRGEVVPDEDGRFELALAQAGLARAFVDGTLLLDGFTNPPPPGGTDFFGQASQDMVGEVQLRAGVPVEVVLEYARIDTQIAGFRLGFRTRNDDALLERAVDAADAADTVVLVVGTDGEWETEGRDRTTLALPGRQHELVSRVAAVSRRTVVVVNAGAPIDLSWADDVAAVLQCWFGGQEVDHAVADVLVGDADPSGRLPTTIPVRLEHSPSHDNFPGENGELRYGEGLFMGYRGFDHRCITPRFAFGHGLSYTTFSFGEPRVSDPSFHPGGTVTVSVPVTNTGNRVGCEVVQCYVAPESPRLARPPKELKAFAKVRLGPGESTVVDLVLDDRSFAYWDPGQEDWEPIRERARAMFQRGEGERRAPGWQVDPGTYRLLVGRSSDDIAATLDITVTS